MVTRQQYLSHLPPRWHYCWASALLALDGGLDYWEKMKVEDCLGPDRNDLMTCVEHSHEKEWEVSLSWKWARYIGLVTSDERRVLPMRPSTCLHGSREYPTGHVTYLRWVHGYLSLCTPCTVDYAIWCAMLSQVSDFLIASDRSEEIRPIPIAFVISARSETGHSHRRHAHLFAFFLHLAILLDWITYLFNNTSTSNYRQINHAVNRTTTNSHRCLKTGCCSIIAILTSSAMHLIHFIAEGSEQAWCRKWQHQERCSECKLAYLSFLLLLALLDVGRWSSQSNESVTVCLDLAWKASTLAVATSCKLANTYIIPIHSLVQCTLIILLHLNSSTLSLHNPLWHIRISALVLTAWWTPDDDDDDDRPAKLLLQLVNS